MVVCLSQNEPAEKKEKESSEELPKVKPTPGQESVHPITIFSFQMIPFQTVVRLQMAEDRLKS